jgi:hypothetical protein
MMEHSFIMSWSLSELITILITILMVSVTLRKRPEQAGTVSCHPECSKA